MTIFYAIVLLGIVIFFHELGHFLAARLSGVKVLKFSLGFGPKIAGIKRNDTEYLISAIPLGGYVKLYGESPDEEIPEGKRHLSFTHKPVSRRAFIVFSGPLFNILLAVVIFAGVYTAGIPVLTSEIGEVMKDSVAERAGLRAGDRVIEIDGQSITAWDELASRIQRSPEKPINIKVRRQIGGGVTEIIVLTVIPKKEKVKNLFGEEIEVGLIGIKPSDKTFIRRLNPLSALGQGFLKTGEVVSLTLLSIVKLIQRVIPIETLGGPIMIFDIAKKSAEAGAMNFFAFMALISINLGVLNLLPVPILDGGHLLLFLIEKIRGRPLSERSISIAQKIGLAFIILLATVAFYNDIMRLIKGKDIP
jgi:regulator of sigma E protease